MSDMPNNPAAHPRRRRRVWRIAALVAIAVLVLAAGYWWWGRRGPQPATEIFHGVVYGCDRLPENNEGGGLVHWVRVDLRTPELGLYVTPVDAAAAAHGQEYRLQYAGTVAANNHLAVVINGALFTRASWLPVPGTYARSVETAIAAHEVNHVDENSYLLWFEDDLTPHLETTKPPPPDALARARWGIAGSIVLLIHKKINPSADNVLVDQRTTIGIDGQKRLLWMAVFERATLHRAAEVLRDLGATDAIPVDGGHSTEMAIGADAAGVRPGNLMRCWVPIATHFGVQARRLTDGEQ